MNENTILMLPVIAITAMIAIFLYGIIAIMMEPCIFAFLRDVFKIKTDPKENFFLRLTILIAPLFCSIVLFTVLMSFPLYVIAKYIITGKEDF